MRTILQTSMAAFNLYSEYIVGMLVSITIARSLSTYDYGVYSSIIWLSGLYTLFLSAGLNINVTKFVAEFNQQSNSAVEAFLALINRLFIIRFIIVIIIMALIFILGDLELKIATWLLIVILIGATSKARYLYTIAIFKGLKRFGLVALTSVSVSPVNLLLVLLCAYLAPDLQNFLLIFAFVCTLFSLSAMVFGKHIPNAKADLKFNAEHKERINKQILYASMVVVFAGLIFRQSQVFVLEMNDFISQAGFFNIAFIFSTAAITLVPGIYKEILLPKIIEAAANNDAKNQLLQAERYLLILAMLVVFPVIIYAPNIIDLLYGERYSPAVMPLQCLMVFKLIELLKEGANLTLISHDKQNMLAIINGALFVAMVVLSTIFVPTLGLLGSVITFGLLTLAQIISYFYMSSRLGYKFIAFSELLRIVVPAIIMIVPVLLINSMLSGLLAMLIGSAVFILGYINLLFLTKGYDASVLFLLKQLIKVSPQYCSGYIRWGIKQLS